MSTETRRSPHVFNPHNLLTEIMQGLLILATIAIPVVYFAASSIWLIYGIFLFAYIATGFIRAVCRQLYQFILLCLMVVALPLVLPLLPAFSADIWPRLIVIPTLLFFCGRAFYLRIRQDEDKVVNSLFQQSLAILYLLVLNLLAIRLNRRKNLRRHQHQPSHQDNSNLCCRCLPGKKPAGWQYYKMFSSIFW